MGMSVEEILFYKDVRYTMKTFPLTEDVIARTPLVRVKSSGWRGYMGTWEIKEAAALDERLYLTKLNLVDFKFKELCEIFHNATPKGVEAKWFTGELYCDSGKILRTGQFGNVFERTTIFKIDHGKFIYARDIMNR